MDCHMSLEDIITVCQMKGINCLAVCDHGTAEGGLRLQKAAPFKVIVAEEVLTPCGEIMGMFLKETIPSHQPAEQVVQQIKAQGGLVCIPHPCDRFRPSALDGDTLESIADQVDIIEVFNARTIPYQNMNKPADFARKYKLPRSAGSDAHTLSEIGNAYVEMPEFNGRDDFLRSLAQGKIGGRRTSPFIHFLSLRNKIIKRLRKTR